MFVQFGAGSGFSIGFGPAFGMGMMGGMMSSSSSISSSGVGIDFDLYVRKAIDNNSMPFPSPFSMMGPSSRHITDLWKGRQFRIYLNPTKYKIGKVLSWVQSKNGPFSRGTNWSITVAIDDEVFDAAAADRNSSRAGGGDSNNNSSNTQNINIGDVIQINKLPKKYDGRIGDVIKCLPNNKYKVKLRPKGKEIVGQNGSENNDDNDDDDDDDNDNNEDHGSSISEKRKKNRHLYEDTLQIITVKKENIVKAGGEYNPIEFEIVRMNITGGGTLERKDQNDDNEDDEGSDEIDDSDNEGRATSRSRAHATPATPKTTASASATNNNNNDTSEFPVSKKYEYISLEWIDPPTPIIDLHENSTSAKCPTCRAIEPVFSAYIDEDEDQQQEQQEDDKKQKASITCPICTEDTTLFRTLGCNHDICNDCWDQWRMKGTSEIPSSVTQPIIDSDKLQRERDRNYQKLKVILPHTMGGTATKPLPPPVTGWRRIITRSRNNSVSRQQKEVEIDNAMSNFRDKIGTILRTLDEDLYASRMNHGESGSENNDTPGLSSFWYKLMTCSIHLFCIIDIIIEQVSDMCDIAPLEIFMLATVSRSKEIIIALTSSIPDTRKIHKEKKVTPDDISDEIDTDKKNNKKKVDDEAEEQPITFMSEKSALGYVHNLYSMYCNRIGEIHEGTNDYHSAIHWYQRALLHAKKMVELEREELDLLPDDEEDESENDKEQQEEKKKHGEKGSKEMEKTEGDSDNGRHCIRDDTGDDDNDEEDSDDEDSDEDSDDDDDAEIDITTKKGKQRSLNRLLAMRYSNLGLAEKRAGLLERAKSNYLTSIECHKLNSNIGNLESLKIEQSKWTGTSGRLTPGC